MCKAFIRAQSRISVVAVAVVKSLFFVRFSALNIKHFCLQVGRLEGGVRPLEFRVWE